MTETKPAPAEPDPIWLVSYPRSGTNATWRDEMVDDDLSLFWELHGEEMGEFGYHSRGGR